MNKYKKLVIVVLCLIGFSFSSIREKSIWSYKVKLTLKLFSENIYFKKNTEIIKVGSDSKDFLAALERKKYVIKGIIIEPVVLSPNHSMKNLDVVFTNNGELGDKVSKNDILVFTSNEKCTSAAFIITVDKKNKLKIIYNKKNIKNQGAAFPDELFELIDKNNTKR
jgi:hypothetical protein